MVVVVVVELGLELKLRGVVVAVPPVVKPPLVEPRAGMAVEGAGAKLRAAGTSVASVASGSLSIVFAEPIAGAASVGWKREPPNVARSEKPVAGGDAASDSVPVSAAGWKDEPPAAGRDAGAALASAVLKRLAGGALLGLKAPEPAVAEGAAPGEGFSGEPIVRRCS